jgi:5'-nucleotidase
MALILVTNDDGVHAPGLAALAAALEELGEVWIVAPEREQSACGHALTLHRPVRVHQMGERRFAVNGTPSDCVNLGVLGFLSERPALVASGVNHGSNLGDDVTYSGTVSATFEGTLLGIPSVAFSQEVAPGFSFQPAADFAREMVGLLLEERTLPADLLLNVNVPAGAIRGVDFTRLGHRVYQQSVIEKVDPRGRKYYWIAGTPEWQSETGTDHAAVASGRVSVTPLHLDLTDYRSLETYAELAARLASLRPPAKKR